MASIRMGVFMRLTILRIDLRFSKAERYRRSAQPPLGCYKCRTASTSVRTASPAASTAIKHIQLLLRVVILTTLIFYVVLIIAFFLTFFPQRDKNRKLQAVQTGLFVTAFLFIFYLNDSTRHRFADCPKGFALFIIHPGADI